MESSSAVPPPVFDVYRQALVLCSQPPMMIDDIECETINL